MIRVACPHCKRTYRTQTEGMGKTAVCTKCHQAFKIGEARVPFAWRQTDLGEDSWVGVPVPEEKKELRHCIICEAPMTQEQVRCPACGASQVTGVVRRARSESVAAKPSVLAAPPLRLLLVAVPLLLVGTCVYLGFRTLSQSAVETGEQMVHQAIARRAVNHLTEGGDEHTFRSVFAGEVTDTNLPGFVGMLDAADADVRRVGALLIGCGDFTRLRPLLDWGAGASHEDNLRDVLQAIGSKRLVELAVNDDPDVRRDAAESLCRLLEIEPTDQTLQKLAEPTSLADKIGTVNALCRPYPQAVGQFTAVINEQQSPFEVSVEQVGRTFYLRVQSAEFRSLPDRERTFEIPIEHWCAATGPAVDARSVRGLMTGSVTLASPYGASWWGTVRVTARRELRGPLPGFLPIEAPRAGQTVEVAIKLE